MFLHAEYKSNTKNVKSSYSSSDEKEEAKKGEENVAVNAPRHTVSCIYNFHCRYTCSWRGLRLRISLFLSSSLLHVQQRQEENDEPLKNTQNLDLVLQDGFNQCGTKPMRHCDASCRRKGCLTWITKKGLSWKNSRNDLRVKKESMRQLFLTDLTQLGNNQSGKKSKDEEFFKRNKTIKTYRRKIHID